jgi:hypothetical protein
VKKVTRIEKTKDCVQWAMPVKILDAAESGIRRGWKVQGKGAAKSGKKDSDQ